MTKTLSTGKKPFKINFDTGDTEIIYFNPNDPDLAQKLYNLGDIIEEKTKDLNDVEINEDGTPKNEKDIELYAKFKNIIYQEIDSAFDYGVSEKVFKHCSIFASVNGEFFFKLFLDYIAPEIEKEIKKEQNKMQKHIKNFVKK